VVVVVVEVDEDNRSTLEVPKLPQVGSYD